MLGLLRLVPVSVHRLARREMTDFSRSAWIWPSAQVKAGRQDNRRQLVALDLRGRADAPRRTAGTTRIAIARPARLSSVDFCDESTMTLAP
jgi:hypothetical protein